MNQDPSTPPLTPPDLRLRPSPRPVVRLSRKTLTIAGLVTTIAVGGAFLLALQPPQGKTAPAPEPTYSTASQPVSDTLAGLPKTYGDVPQLGAPLPGDLGQPMLDAQSGRLSGASPPIGQSYDPQTMSPQVGEHQASRPAETAAEQAKASALFAQVQGGTEARANMPPPTAPDLLASLLQSTALPTSPAQTATRSSAPFEGSTSDRQIVSPERLQVPASPYLLLAGTGIPAALQTGLQSDLPGLVTAQVTHDIYDSLKGNYLLIPRGSRLLGDYNSSVSFGQRRVQLVWTRLILPNGKSLILDREIAADAEGYAGLSDRTDFHWGGVFKAGLLSTTLSIGAQSASSDESDLSRAIREGASDSVSRTGRQIIDRQLNIQPTLTIRPGFPVSVIVSRDLVLEPYGD